LRLDSRPAPPLALEPGVGQQKQYGPGGDGADAEEKEYNFQKHDPMIGQKGPR
jgi:hypothetical protein